MEKSKDNLILKLYEEEINRGEILSTEKQKELAKRAQQGDEKARNSLIETNLRLVKNIARKRSWNIGELLELIQEGNLGLILSVDNYDPTKAAFTTYASYRIKSRINRGIENDIICRGVFKIPIHRQEKGEDSYPNQKKERIYNKFGEERILDQNEEEVHQKLSRKYFMEEIFSVLSEEEEELINYRFFEELTLREIGKKLGVSRQTVLDRERKVLERLKRFIEVKYPDFSLAEHLD